MTVMEYSEIHKNIFLGNQRPQFSSPYIIEQRPPFEIVRLPDGQVKKLAYNDFFDLSTTDFEIECGFIRQFEWASNPNGVESVDAELADAHRERLKFHYRRAIAINSPKMAQGWNRWAETILCLFTHPVLYKVLWGSGGCGKSSVEGLLQYIRWRVNPFERLTVVASMVLTESKARVFQYITEFHSQAPASSKHKIVAFSDNKAGTGICTQFRDPAGKWANNYRGCIIVLPIKVDADSETLGDNLIGSHPEDLYTVCFDEAQEIWGRIKEMKIFLNWISNPKVEFHAWGNPNPVVYHEVSEYDLLFRLGVRDLDEKALKDKEKVLEKCDSWYFDDTAVLRLSTLDSPKDDPEEANNYYMEFGNRKHRLGLLAGKENVAKADKDNIPKYSASYYSQIYGFPFIDYTGEGSKGVLTPKIVKLSKDYPFQWRVEPGAMGPRLNYFMGVDSAPTGDGDACSIACGRLGLMTDGRLGLQVMEQYCLTLHREESFNGEFTDYVIQQILQLSTQLRIPIWNIGVETHSSGEVLKYALENSIVKDKKWGNAWKTHGKFFIVSPVIAPTDRRMFKEIGKFQPADEVVHDINTEYYLAVRCAAITRQIFGIPEKALQQFYTRQLLMNSNNTKYRIETKKEMKKRGLKSPNDADAITNLVEVARRRGGFDFRFRTTGGYEAFYTDERDRDMEDFKMRQRMGKISSSLGIGVDVEAWLEQIEQDEGEMRKAQQKVYAVGLGHFNGESV